MSHAERSRCPLASGLDLLGDRWSLLIIRDLMFFGEREYGQLLRSGEEISTNVLADRLGRLVTAGLVSKHGHPTHGKKYLYRLESSGRALAPVIVELLAWSADTMGSDGLLPPIRKKIRTGKQALIRELLRGQPLYSSESV